MTKLMMYLIRYNLHMKVYENIIIGNFLYALGFAVSAKSNARINPAAVSLLQQTKADTSLADLLLDFPGTFRLIEFKREENESGKEQVKQEALVTLINAYEHGKLSSISRSCHWYIETSSKNDTLTSNIAPYIDAFPVKEKVQDFWGFVNQTATAAFTNSEQYTPEEINEYLDFVITSNGAGDVTTGGMILMVNADGRIDHCQLGSLNELRLEVPELIKVRSIEIEKEHAKTKQKLKSKNMGMGM